MDFQGDLKMSELTQDEINAILANIDIDDAQVNKDTWRASLSEVMQGKLKGKKYPDRVISEETRSKLRESSQKRTQPAIANIVRRDKMSIYEYYTPKGVYQTITDMFSAYDGEVKPNRLRVWCKENKHGFSRRLKDV